LGGGLDGDSRILGKIWGCELLAQKFRRLPRWEFVVGRQHFDELHATNAADVDDIPNPRRNDRGYLAHCELHSPVRIAERAVARHVAAGHACVDRDDLLRRLELGLKDTHDRRTEAVRGSRVDAKRISGDAAADERLVMHDLAWSGRAHRSCRAGRSSRAHRSCRSCRSGRSGRPGIAVAAIFATLAALTTLSAFPAFSALSPLTALSLTVVAVRNTPGDVGHA
jgi:hypothetical protein